MRGVGSRIQIFSLLSALSFLSTGCHHWVPHATTPSATGQFRAMLHRGDTVYGETLVNTGSETFVLVRSPSDSVDLRVSEVERLEARKLSGVRTAWLGAAIVIPFLVLRGYACVIAVCGP